MYHIFDFVRRKEGALHRAVVFQVVSGTVSGPDHGGDRALEVSDRGRSLEDADAVVVPGVFSIGEDPVHGACGGMILDRLAGAVLCRGEDGAVREGICRG